MIVLIVSVRQLPQPWRGMVDAGVVVGLTWGVVSIITSMCVRWPAIRRKYPPSCPTTSTAR